VDVTSLLRTAVAVVTDTMTLRTLSLLATSAVIFPFVAAGCSSSSGGGSSCPEGAQQSCSCEDGTTGTQTCGGEGFGACACGSSPDSGGADTGQSGGDGGNAAPESSTGDEDDHCNGCGDGGGLGDANPLDAAPGTFGASCAANSDCNSMDCWDFPAKGGGFCTVPCTQASDCPPQAQGCNGMGQCKVP
jgi:hypothetical protein